MSVNVGLPREVPWQGRTVFTGVWKEPVSGVRRVRRTNIDGDGQGDLAGHGGEQRAVYVYQLDSYDHWRDQLQRDDLTYGQLGENFTVDGLRDDEVCIGDRYRIGTAVFEVTQPRVTCYRVGIRMNEPRMAALLTGHGRPGFYLRVIEEGDVQAGDDIVQVATGPGGVTVAAVNALLYLDRRPDPELVERALQVPALSPGWRTSLLALLEQSRAGSAGTGNAGLTSVAPPPAWPGFRSLRVAAKRTERVDAVSLELEADDGGALAPPLPGQFVVLRLRPDGGSPVVRSYSLSGPPAGSRYRVTVKVEPHGAAGGYLRSAVDVGTRLDVAAPRGQFTLDASERPVVLVSAGVGVTPVLAMLHGLHDTGSTREVWWFHGTRSGAEHVLADETRSLLAAMPGAHSRIWFSRPGPDDRIPADYDEAGHLTSEGIAAAGTPTDGEFFLCGPAAFMAATRSGLVERLGVPAARVHTETFGAEGATTPGIAPQAARAPHPPEGSPGVGPLVSFVRSGLNVSWDPAFASVLELAEACDVPVRWSCRTGVCHTCETGLLSGEVAYGPEPLEPAAVGNLLLCCSQPRSELAIDL